MKKILILCILLGASTLSLTSVQPNMEWKKMPVADVLFQLGEPEPEHYLWEITPEMIKSGRELVHTGRTVLPDGSKTSYISKYFTCTSCHNVAREDPDLKVVDQDARLAYAIANKLPYLQASTFWGIVNRETWYNDDYILKYGELVRKAEHSLEESIQLCATVCSQGRKLAWWEMNNIIAYFWSLQMHMEDLDWNESEWNLLTADTTTRLEKMALIKSRYLLKSPATFTEPPVSKSEGYPFEGNAVLGEAIYDLGCRHCHRPYGESDIIFDHTALSLDWLEKNITESSEESIYEIIRKGTYAEYGHKEYMPHYTLEKMSHQQVEHLRAFIESGD